MAAEPRDCIRGLGPTALVFPGVGVKLSGRERVFYDAHEQQMAPLFSAASRYIDIDLESILHSDKVETLADGTRQFFTYAFSAGAADAALEEITPTAAAGYSFGIYAALYAARVYTFEQGLEILDNAYRIMAAAVAGGNLGMGVVVGLDADELQDIIRSGGFESVAQTNTNHNVCHIFSGRLEEIDRFLACAEQGGAFKFQRLEVNIPYHHPLFLQTAPDALKEHLDAGSWSRAAFPVVSSIDGGLLSDPPAISDFVARHLATPISWQRAVDALHLSGVRTLLECGPGISLTQNGRFLPYEMTYVNVKKATKCRRG